MKRLRGFAIVSAIFILVVLAALGAFIVNVSTSQHIGSALDVQGVRAYHAARAGIEWGLYRVTRDLPAYTTMTAIPAPAANSLTWCTGTSSGAPTRASFGFTPTSMGGFIVTVECFATQDSSGGPWVFSVRATACNQPITGWIPTTTACPNTAPTSALYIERRMEVVF